MSYTRSYPRYPHGKLLETCWQAVETLVYIVWETNICFVRCDKVDEKWGK